MATTTAIRFPIRFDGVYGALSTALFLSPSRSYVEVLDGHVAVHMAWAFRASFPQSAVAAATVLERRPMSRGVHGWGGRWLVNGSGDGIVTIDLQPTQRASVLGFPVKLRQLMVSVDDPDRLLATLKPQPPNR